MADSLTKFDPYPIKIINSKNFRQGPPILTENNFESKIKVFYEVEGKNFKYAPIFNDKKDILSLQNELEVIFDDKAESRVVNMTQTNSNFKKIMAFPESTLNLFNNTLYFFKGILTKPLYKEISNYFSFKMVFRKLKLLLAWPLHYLKSYPKIHLT